MRGSRGDKRVEMGLLEGKSEENGGEKGWKSED